MEGILEIFRNDPWLIIPIMALSIPIVAIVVGGIERIVKMIIRHRERIALIQQGVPPDRLDAPDQPDAKCQTGTS